MKKIHYHKNQLLNNKNLNYNKLIFKFHFNSFFTKIYRILNIDNNKLKYYELWLNDYKYNKSYLSV